MIRIKQGAARTFLVETPRPTITHGYAGGSLRLEVLAEDRADKPVRVQFDIDEILRLEAAIATLRQDWPNDVPMALPIKVYR